MAKLWLAILVYILIGVVLGGGILLVMRPQGAIVWPLIVAFVAYCVAFAKIGCMTGD